jgi:hypothetical protein
LAKGIWKLDPELNIWTHEGQEWGADNEKLQSLYRSPNIVMVIKSRRLNWANNLARLKEGRSPFKILTGKPTGKRSSGRPTLRWEDNIRMGNKEIGVITRNWDDST